MKHGKILVPLTVLSILCGCGHSVLIDRESTGIAVMIPVGEGSLGVCVGNMKCSTASLRGGASVETATTGSGGLFSGFAGVSKITNFKTNAQLNEGNLVKVLTSPDVPESAKVALATNLAAAAKAPKFMPSIMQTEASTIHLGSEAIQSNAVELIERKSSGLDKVVETIPQITTPIVSTVTDVVDHTAGKMIDSTTHIVERTVDWAIMVKWLGIISGICLVLLAWLKGKGKKDDSDDDEPKTPKQSTSKKRKTTCTASTCSFTQSGETISTKADPIVEEIDVEAAMNVEPDEDDDFSEETSPKKKKSWWSKFLYVLAALFGLAAKMPDDMKKKIAHTTVDWMKNTKQKKDEKNKETSEEKK